LICNTDRELALLARREYSDEFCKSRIRELTLTARLKRKPSDSAFFRLVAPALVTRRAACRTIFRSWKPPPPSPKRDADRCSICAVQAFAESHTIPARFTADGEDVSPPLTWSQTPKGTVELALLVDDPDAPGGEPWVHWIVTKIPADRRDLPEGFLRAERAPRRSFRARLRQERLGDPRLSRPEASRGTRHPSLSLQAIRPRCPTRPAGGKRQAHAARSSVGARARSRRAGWPVSSGIAGESAHRYTSNTFSLRTFLGHACRSHQQAIRSCTKLCHIRFGN